MIPEVDEVEHHGHTTWAVRDKGIAWARPFSKSDLKRFGDQAPPAERRSSRSTPRTCTPAVLVELGAIDERDRRDLLVDAWLAAAPAELVGRFDG